MIFSQSSLTLLIQSIFMVKEWLLLKQKCKWAESGDVILAHAKHLLFLDSFFALSSFNSLAF